MIRIRYRTFAIGLVIPLLLVVMLFIGVRSASALTENCFTDVTTGMWFHDYVCWMFDAGLTAGYPDGTYRPYNNITRAEIAVMMQQLSGEGAVGPVVDAENLDGLDSSDFASSGHSHVVSKTEYESISGAVFQCLAPLTSCLSSQWGYKWGNNITTLLTFAPVELPNNATVTRFQCFWLDDSTTVDVDINIFLRRSHFNIGGLPNNQNLASLADSTTGTSLFILTDSTTSISSSVIDNANYGYYIYHTMTRTSSPDLLDSNIRNYGCRIEYSLDETIP